LKITKNETSYVSFRTCF